MNNKFSKDRNESERRKERFGLGQTDKIEFRKIKFKMHRIISEIKELRQRLYFQDKKEKKKEGKKRSKKLTLERERFNKTKKMRDIKN